MFREEAVVMLSFGRNCLGPVPLVVERSKGVAQPSSGYTEVSNQS